MVQSQRLGCVLLFGLTLLLLAAPGPAAGDGTPRPGVPDAGLSRQLDELDFLVGDWSVAGEWTVAGRADKLVGTWSGRWVLGGRYLRFEFYSQVGEARTIWYEGLYTFNPTSRRYESIWVSSEGARWEESGTLDEKGALVMTGRLSGPAKEQEFDDYLSVYRRTEAGGVEVVDSLRETEAAEWAPFFRIDLKPR